MLVALSFFALSAANAQELTCGRSNSVSDVTARLRSDPMVRHWPRHTGISTYFDPATLTLWWIANEGDPAFPAALCRPLGQAAKSRCEGNARACKRLIQDMNKVKF